MTIPHNQEIWNSIEIESIATIQETSSKTLLPDQLQYVIDKSPFYKNKYKPFLHGNYAYDSEFMQRLPVTDKKELLDDQTNYPAFGSNLCIEEKEALRIHKTSGTTDKPLIVAYAKDDIEHTHEAGARCFWASGLRPGHCVVHCLNYCMWAGGVTDHLSLESTGATVIPYGVANSKSLIDMMLLIRPNAIHCTPSYLSKLEIILRNDFGMEPKQLNLRLGLFGAEGGVDDPNFRSAIELKWELKAMNANYGMSDVLSMFGAECSAQDGLHFMGQGILFVEIIDSKTLEFLPIETGVMGELVLTHLRKKSQPLVRYRTYDVVEIISTDRCECGRRGFRFKVIGRNDDMIVVKGVNVFPGAIASVLNRHLDHLTGEYQILLDRGNPARRIKIEAELKAGVSEVQSLHSHISEELKNKLSVKPELQFLNYGIIPRTEGKSKRVKRIL